MGGCRSRGVNRVSHRAIRYIKSRLGLVRISAIWKKSDMDEIRACLIAVRQRQQRQWMWQCVSVGLIASALTACVLAVIRSFQWLDVSSIPVAGILAIGPVLGWGCSVLRSRCERDAAAAIDQAYHLKDRTTTALGFLNNAVAPTVWQELQLEDAKLHLATVEPQSVAPIRAPRSWICGLLISSVAIGIGGVGTPAIPVVAKILSNDVMLAHLHTVEQGLKELKEFDAEDVDPEMEELLTELAAGLKELRQPHADLRETLAKLSEMEAVVQEKRQKLKSLDTAIQLGNIGEALSLSDNMQAAGKAMADGELGKAAAELLKLDLPELTRQTQKAITEKLEQVQQARDSKADRKLKEAVAQTTEGLRDSDHQKFQEGMEGLAGECEKQRRCRKLSDLLNKQWRCLSDCKSECESEIRTAVNSNKPGGTNWGNGKSVNLPRKETPKLNTGNTMNLVGQKSDSGESDIETMTAHETAQEAIRRYRQQSEKYEQLTESVLESESIPLGQRQTIRRYFEMIRPQAAEADVIDQRLDTAE